MDERRVAEPRAVRAGRRPQVTNLIRISKVIVIATVALWLLPKLFTTRVKPGDIGVRQSAASGVYKDDLGAGMHWRIPGLHKIITLPSGYTFLDYASDEPSGGLSIRTKDNNTVQIDVTVPIRIRRGEAHSIVREGNHVKDGNRYRFEKLAAETTVSVLREELANLTSVGWYSTDKRLEISQKALEMLNEQLKDLHLEAQTVLIRSIKFRDEYERQLTQIQLNEQNKLLDQARQKVAAQQQILDNYTQGSSALASAKEQDWVKRQAELERAYQVGFIVSDDSKPGAARKALAAMTPEQVTALKTEAAKVFGLDGPESVTDAYLIGIKNIQAETLEYKNRVNAEADGISARLEAEGDAMVAKVQGEYESKLNALLSSPAGRAYVAWNAAANVSFSQTLTFSSQEGIPSVLRLRRFAEQFMGSGR
jgi:regulator of protease activity HflC (stomatin/prohibitin superfamily)